MKYFILIALFVTSCAVADTKQTLVLDYGNFGPQAAAWELLGMEWWQWQSHGDSRPRKYDVKVVVYRDIALEAVQKKYPVSEPQQKDYRYVRYSEALKYLDQKIEENMDPTVTETLKATKTKIINEFRN